MPLSKYFKGHGREVMADMKDRYGDRGESVFYATANAKGMTPRSRKFTRRSGGKKNS